MFATVTGKSNREAVNARYTNVDTFAQVRNE